MATATARLGHALALERLGRFALAPEVPLVLEVLLKVPRLAIELELRVLGLLARDPLDVLTRCARGRARLPTAGCRSPSAGAGQERAGHDAGRTGRAVGVGSGRR